MNKPKECKLCKTKEANQTGSHLTSCFIVASQLGKRGQENGYLITSDPEQDYTINHEANLIKEDFILCGDCEKRLSFVEGYFSQEFTNKIDRPNYAPNFPILKTGSKFDSKYYNCNLINPVAFHLLIYSIIWRASISNKILFRGFKLDEKSEEDLRILIDLHLPEYKNRSITPSLKQWLKDLITTPDFFKLYPYVILKTDDSEMFVEGIPEDELVALKLLKQRNPLYFAAEEDHPYHIIINEYIILPFFKNAPIQFEKQDFFELNDKYDLSEQMNSHLTAPKVGVIDAKHWSLTYYKLYSILKNQRLYNMRKECLKYYIMKGGNFSKKDIVECVAKKHSEYDEKIKNGK